MDILIAAFSGIAFVALIVYLWKSVSDPKESTRETARSESQKALLDDQLGAASSASPEIRSERLAQLEQTIDGLMRQRAEMLSGLEDQKQKDAVSQLELRDAQARNTQSLQRLAELEAENALLHRRCVDQHNQENNHQDEVVSLREQLGNLTAFEQQAGILQREKSELMEQLKKLEAQNAADARIILALQDLEIKQPQLEQKLATLREENGRLLSEITGLQSSLRDKIKTQLDGLQELYKNLTPGLN
jgi:chromosome segregation ATPase